MRFNLKRDGLFDPAKLDAWTAAKKQQLRAAAVAGMKEGGRALSAKLQDHLRTVLNVQRASFARLMSYRVFADRPDRLPSLQVGAIRAPWLDSQAGGTIRPRSGGRGLLIPLTADGKRMGAKRFRRVVQQLISQRNAYFVNVNGKIILFAEKLKGDRANQRSLRRFRGRVDRKEREVPIAVLVPQVQMKARLKVGDVVKNNIGLVTSAIERNMKLGD